MDALRLENVTYHYPGDGRAALDHVVLSVEAGEFVLLVGGSGSGKSTLLRAAAGLVPHFHGGRLEGRVTAEGMDTREHDPRQIARLAGLVFQDPERQLVMRRARREVAFGLENLGHPAAEIAARAEEAMMVTGASRLAERPVERLSGGEQQRVAIASILAMGHRLLLLDEPTSQLDPVAAEELLGLIVRINRDRGVTVVLAEHRTGRLFGEADRVIQLEAGAVVLDAPPPAAAAVMAHRSRWLLPPVAQAFAAAGRSALPLSVREARRLVPQASATPDAA
ncbi:MAG TPA: ABC transporter ATP-binding protein, partial [Gaiellales bacterium]|nr:ABC transporter ATP-binding protein [Gaiellales bacterium]